MSYRDHLAHRMNVLRDLLGSPHQPYRLRDDPKAGESVCMPNVGFVGMEHNQYTGYRVFEINNDAGGERNLCEGLKVHECINFINGAIMALQGRCRLYGGTDDS